MSDQTTNTHEKKIDKEKTVKKRAARSIVAPRIEEETGSPGASRKGTSYIPGTSRPPKPEKKASVIVSPASVHSQPGKVRTPKVISAPAGVVLNDDKLPPVQKKTQVKATATGWPERPPTPRVPERSSKPSAVSQQTGRQASQSSGAEAPRGNIPSKASPEVQNAVSDKSKEPVRKQPPTPQRVKPAVTASTGPMPRKMVKTVVTTTTTTYEPVTEEELRQLEAQALAQSQTQPGRGVQTTVIREIHPQQTPAKQVVRQQPGRPVQNAAAQGAQGQRVRQGQQGTAPVIRTQGANVQGTQTTGLQQGRQVPQNTQQPGSQTNPQAPAPQKPLTAMDRQLAEIEKALGLSGQPPAENTQPPSQNPQTSVPAVPPAVPGAQTPGQQGIPGQPAMDSQTRKSMEYLMLGVEALIFIIVLCVCISIYQKIKNKDYAGGPDEATAYEENTGESSDENAENSGTESFDVEEAGEGDELYANGEGLSDELQLDDGGSGSDAELPDSVDVDNDKFTLKCTNITVTLDTNGSPAALIYFTFTNKTSEQLSMSEVFPPSVMQNGEACETFASLDEYPEEFYNKDMKISDGSTINCCYSVALKDAVSPIRLTIHDNYEAFADIGSTEIPIQ